MSAQAYTNSETAVKISEDIDQLNQKVSIVIGSNMEVENSAAKLMGLAEELNNIVISI